MSGSTKGMQQDILSSAFHDIDKQCQSCGYPTMKQSNKKGVLFDKNNKPVGYGNRADVCPNCGFPVNQAKFKDDQQQIINSELAKALRTASINSLMYGSIYNDSRIMSNGFNNFDTNTEQLKQFKFLAKQKENEFIRLDNYKLFISGQTGTGKTHVSMAIMQDVLEKRNYRKGMKPYISKVINWPAYLEMHKQAMGNKDISTQLKNKLSDLSKTDFVLLDDLGAEITNNSRASEYAINLLLSLSERISNKALIITTNFTAKELTKIYGSRVVGRLIENINPITTEGIADHRFIFN